MEILTKHFGMIEYTKEEVVHFQDGLFGFEEYKEYLPIPLEEDSDAIICFQSLDDQDVAFIAMNPFILSDTYHPEISDTDRKTLGDPKDDDISYYCICVMKDSLEDSRINLKCPIAVNALTRSARQLILDQPGYELRHQIKDLSITCKKEERSHVGPAKKEKPVAGHKR